MSAQVILTSVQVCACQSSHVINTNLSVCVCGVCLSAFRSTDHQPNWTYWPVRCGPTLRRRGPLTWSLVGSCLSFDLSNLYPFTLSTSQLLKTLESHLQCRCVDARLVLLLVPTLVQIVIRHMSLWDRLHRCLLWFICAAVMRNRCDSMALTYFTGLVMNPLLTTDFHSLPLHNVFLYDSSTLANHPFSSLFFPFRQSNVPFPGRRRAGMHDVSSGNLSETTAVFRLTVNLPASIYCIRKLLHVMGYMETGERGKLNS